MTAHYNLPHSCPHCGQWMSEDLLAEKRRLKAQRVSAALKEAWAQGGLVGRGRSANYDEIFELRKKGLTMREIAKRLSCSTFTVQRAIKVKAGAV